MRRGDVLEMAVGGRVLRMVIVSSNEYPTHLSAVPIYGDEIPEAGRISTTPGDSGRGVSGDPVRGVIDVRRQRPIDPALVRARLGRMTRDTMRRIGEAQRAYLDLP